MHWMRLTQRESSTATSSLRTFLSTNATTQRFWTLVWRNFHLGRCCDSPSWHPTAAMEELLTSPGTAVGTIAYMSPEQARGEELDARTDLFSFGAVLYEMATGRMAFRGNTAAVIHDAILNRAPIPLAQMNPELPLKLGEIINKSLEKDHKLRYQHAADIRNDLRQLKRGTDPGRTAVAILRPGQGRQYPFHFDG